MCGEYAFENKLQWVERAMAIEKYSYFCCNYIKWTNFLVSFLFCSYGNALGIILDVNAFLKDANVFFHALYFRDLPFSCILKQRTEDMNCSFITCHNQSSHHIVSKFCWEVWGLGWLHLETTPPKAVWPWVHHCTPMSPSINRSILPTSLDWRGNEPRKCMCISISCLCKDFSYITKGCTTRIRIWYFIQKFNCVCDILESEVIIAVCNKG